ncbi:MAG TPA: hypothetical protein VHT51_16810 [Micropepsaceae bacterium]|nr:hypothetical protein [Micropepsaceae bacterium]
MGLNPAVIAGLVPASHELDPTLRLWVAGTAAGQDEAGWVERLSS